MIQPSSKPLTGLAPRISPPRWMSSRRPTGGPAFCERLRRAMSLSEYFRHHQKLHFCRDSCDKQQDLGIAFFQTTATDVCVCQFSHIFDARPSSSILASPCPWITGWFHLRAHLHVLLQPNRRCWEKSESPGGTGGLHVKTLIPVWADPWHNFWHWHRNRSQLF